jgi:hypothetical protein
MIRMALSESLFRILPFLYDYTVEFINGDSETFDKDVENIRCLVLLNHTSFFEFFFMPAFTRKFLSHLQSSALNVPVAQETLDNYPPLRFIFKTLAGSQGCVVPVSRKRDSTWNDYLKSGKDNIWFLMPEGRMKRSTGLDKHGKKMTVQGGLADVLKEIPDGKLVVLYSGGLHHVAHPGVWLPRVFKKMHYKLELLDIAELNERFNSKGSFKRYMINLVDFFDKKRDQVCPEMEDLCLRP